MTPDGGAEVLAHAGGIPEVLSVAVPLVLLGAILHAGRRRERAEREAQAATEDEAGDDVSS